VSCVCASTVAEQLRKDVKRLETQIKRAEDDEARIQAILDMDFGSENEYAYMHSECYSVKKQQYDYVVCPFADATQKEGKRGTEIGVFDSWEVDEANGVRRMLFKNGQSCWNGPKRSITVSLRCGGTTYLDRIDEPSMCVYTADLYSPAACTEGDVAALTADFEATFGALPDSHVHTEL
jgi:protein kinase C substrate 80K-H